MVNENLPFQKITDDRNFIIDCFVQMLSKINEHKIISLIINNPQKLTIKLSCLIWAGTRLAR